MSYSIVSGYNPVSAAKSGHDFFKLWCRSVLGFQPLAANTFIISDSGSMPPPIPDFEPLKALFGAQVIRLGGDLGNHLQLLDGSKKYQWSGWTGAMLSGAMLCYTNCTDMVFIEQDCLCFGDVIGTMCNEIGDAGIIFGSYDKMPAAQSLFMVRHHYIPEFVRLFLGEGPQTEPQNMGEHIFGRLEQRYPDQWKRFSFGYDRQRPFNTDDKVFYVQQLAQDEIALLKLKKLL